MGTISSSIGLISGIDIQGLIDQLMAIEARPRVLVERRVSVLQSQKGAFLDINARLLALKSAATSLSKPDLFNTKKATSSNTSVLTATASKNAAIGTYNLTVDRLVSTHQLITKGYADSDTALFGATTLRFDSHLSRLDGDVKLTQLNSGDGVQRGRIRITDRSGAVSDVDLTRAATVDDVIKVINNASNINVTASLGVDGITITDNTGLTTSNLIVSDLGTTTTAANLGIAGNSGGTNVITGTQINRIGTATSLSGLNDGIGVRILGAAQDDLTITLQDTSSFNVSLSGASTIGDVIDAINTAGGGSVTASIAANGVSLRIVDNTAGAGTLTVAAANGSGAAADLGVAGSDGDADGDIEGERLVASLGSKLLKNLRGGSGIDLTAGTATLSGATALSALLAGAGLTTDGTAAADLSIQNRKGDTYTIDVDALNTVQDLIDAFDTATGGDVTLAISGQSLVATNHTSGGSSFIIADINGAAVAAELGIAINSPSPGGPDSITGVDTAPASSPSFTVTNRAGVSTDINLAGALSVRDVIEQINAAGAGVTASLNAAGNGLKLTDTTGSTASNLIVVENGGSLASQLGLITGPGGVAASTINGGDLDLRYISVNSRLTDLNGGKGVTVGRFKISDSNGVSAIVDLTQGDEKTLQDVIDEINSRPTDIVATINATGDGILLTDTAGGALRMKVEEDGSTTARDLGILGEDEDDDGVIDGSFEKTIEVDADDTLDDVVNKINSAGIFVSASVINDGSGTNAFRLNIASKRSGVAGRIVFDDGGLNLGASNLVRGEDARVLFGSADPTQALLLNSSSNTLSKTVTGVTINLVNPSEGAVQLTVAKDEAAVVNAAKTLVTSFNAFIDTTNKYDTYNQETEQRGLLLGDATVSQLRRRLFSLINAPISGVGGQYKTLAQVGLTVGEGAKLQLNEDRFKAALAADPDAVLELFTSTAAAANPAAEDLPPGVTLPVPATTQQAVGFAKRLEELVEAMTNSFDGTITLRTNSIDAQVELANKRIQQLNILLASKRDRLERQFNAMENALASLQTQQGSLQALANASSFQFVRPRSNG